MLSLIQEELAQNGVQPEQFISLNFENCTGLHNDNHYSTCRDIAVLMSECLKSDTFREIVTREVYTTAVSYTHLDVYKRQIRGIMCESM